MPRIRAYGKASEQLKLSLPTKVRETLQELYWRKRAESVNALCVEMILEAIRAEGLDPFGGRDQFPDIDTGPRPQKAPYSGRSKRRSAAGA